MRRDGVLDADGAHGLAAFIGASIEIEGGPGGRPRHVGGVNGVFPDIASDTVPRPSRGLLQLDVVSEGDDADGRGRRQAGLAPPDRQRRPAGGRGLDPIASPQVGAVGEGTGDAITNQGRTDSIHGVGGGRDREHPTVE